MKKYEKEPWSEAERKILQDYYHTLSSEELSKILPGRSRNAMAKQVQYLKRRNRSFKT